MLVRDGKLSKSCVLKTLIHSSENLIPHLEQVAKAAAMAMAVPAAVGLKFNAQTWRPSPAPARVLPGCVRSQASSEQAESSSPRAASRRLVLQVASAAMACEAFLLPDIARAEPSEPAVTQTVFLDVAIDGQPAGRIVIGLYGADVPVGAARFRDIAVGQRGISFRRKEFIKITPSYIQNAGLRTFSLSGGAADAARFTGGETADALVAEMEALAAQGRRPRHLQGAVSMVAVDASKPPPKPKLVARDGKLVVIEEEARPGPNGTEFMVLTRDAPELEATNLVVGRVVQGMDVVEKIAAVRVVQENTSSPYFQAAKFIGDSRVIVAERGFNRPYAKISVTKCGQVEQ